MKNEWIILAVIAIVVGLTGTILLMRPIVAITPEPSNYEVYYAEAPFGILWRSTTAGNLIFGNGRTTSLQETYIIKFWDENNLLQSMTIDASNCGIAVDGSFKLTIAHKNYATYPFPAKPTWENYQQFYGYRDRIVVILHLPGIPEMNQTANWIIVDG